MGLEHRNLAPIQAIGVDEIQYVKGHKYLTLVYQIEQGCTRLLWIGKDRTVESFEQFFTLIGKPLSEIIEFVCSGMWKLYFRVIRPPRKSRVLAASGTCQTVGRPYRVAHGNQHVKGTLRGTAAWYMFCCIAGVPPSPRSSSPVGPAQAPPCGGASLLAKRVFRCGANTSKSRRFCHFECVGSAVRNQVIVLGAGRILPADLPRRHTILGEDQQHQMPHIGCDGGGRP